MVVTIRKPEIISIARREGMVSVDRLVEHFGVTPQTIRRDLTELADAGQLERVHGGAVLPSTTVNIAYEERRQLNQPSKVEIARNCANHIPNDCSLFLNIGTTTEAVASELLNHQGLLVVTNNTNIAAILSASEDIEVIVTGGKLRRTDGGLVGDLARSTIEQFNFDFAVIGCSALRSNGDLMDFDMQEVGVSKAIIAHSDQVFLVADNSKFERKAPVRVATMGDIAAVFTDKSVPPECSAACEASGTKVVSAQA